MAEGNKPRPRLSGLKNARPENIFLGLASLFGLLLVFVTPPALVGDEPNHFFRAYQIADGHVFGEKRDGMSGGPIPFNVVLTNRKLVGNIEMNEDVKFDTGLLTELRRLPLNDSERMFVHFPNTVVYTPLPYAPQVVGILASKAFGLSPLSMIYATRITNLIAFLALAYAAIRRTPVHKWVFCLLWLTPTTIFQAASASVDAFTFGVCFLAISYFLSYALDEKRKVGSAALAKIFALSLVAVLSKQAYVLLPLLYLMIPRDKFPSRRAQLVGFGALLVVCFGAVAAWSAAVKPIYMPYRSDIPIDPDGQARYVTGQPFTFLWTALRQYWVDLRFYFESFFGQLTWLDLYVPFYFDYAVCAVVVAVALLDKEPHVRVTKAAKAVCVVILVPTALLVSLLLYMTWSPIRGEAIEGIQGRYFIPVAPLFFLLLYNRRMSWPGFARCVRPIAYTTGAASLLITLFAVINRYYV
jgi:uncharacterized membrane protein